MPFIGDILIEVRETANTARSCISIVIPQSLFSQQTIKIHLKINALAAAGSGPQIEPGTQEITSTVTLYFEKK